MARYGIRKYLGVVFAAVVIVPAVVLSLLAIRAISHEEAYIEKQLEGTLAAEVTHVSSVVATEVDRVYSELVASAVIPVTDDPSEPFEEWKRNSPLVGVPFLLSPDHRILWPLAPSHAAAKGAGRRGQAAAAEKADDMDQAFVFEQQAFFGDEEEIPVYENIAVAFQDEILGEVLEPEEPVPTTTVGEASTGEDTKATSAHEFTRATSRAVEALSTAPDAAPRDVDAGEAGLRQKMRPGDQSRKQAAITEFQQSEEVRQRVFDKAELEGQQFAFRNVEVAKRGEASEAEDALKEETVAEKKSAPADAPIPLTAGSIEKEDRPRDDTAESPLREEDAKGRDISPEDVSRIRSIFISQPLRFSEIVAERQSGLIPRTMDGRLQHLYWQRLADGSIIGCLIDSQEFRDRMIGALPAIYSEVRILTVLDEAGEPLIVPRSVGDRDWRRPFVAREISELLPRWESAAYLTRPDAITSRARATTMVMWILILILFVSILAGSVLVLRSAYAEVRLARQRTSFVANVSHELKTPLTSIRMFAEMLRDGRQADPEKQRHYLEIMTAETERLTRLINNVLDFSRMERGEKRYNMKRCDLAALTRDIVESHRARLENNGFEVVLTMRTGVLAVDADEEAVKQAIVNLLSNAEKYSPVVKKIEIETMREDDSAVVSVSDRGVGIPPRHVKNIFDEFYRVDDTLTSEVKGAGLGLTIARKIMRDHGGRIHYTAREGGGSRFEIALPLAGEEGRKPQ